MKHVISTRSLANSCALLTLYSADIVLCAHNVDIFLGSILNIIENVFVIIYRERKHFWSIWILTTFACQLQDFEMTIFFFNYKLDEVIPNPIQWQYCGIQSAHIRATGPQPSSHATWRPKYACHKMVTDLFAQPHRVGKTGNGERPRLVH